MLNYLLFFDLEVNMSSIFFIGISILLITICIYIIKNKEETKKKMENKKIKIIVLIIFLFFSIFFIIKQYENILEIIKLYDWYCISKENEKMYVAYDKMIEEENTYYKEVINKDYENQKTFEPYIPEGFNYVEGSWNTGFIIQDANMNQYVWVPCSNKEKEGIEKLQRLNFSKNTFISKNLCNNKEYKKFLISALENGGFIFQDLKLGKRIINLFQKKELQYGMTLQRMKQKKL